MGKPVLHQHAFWVYGVIVGLAIKEALSTVLPRLLAFLNVSPDSLIASLSEGWKLFVFLVVIIRFYLGSAIFFHEFHKVEKDDADSKVDTEALPKGYVTDLMSGLIHFILFFAWSLTFTIAPVAGQHFRPTVYEILLLVILLYDFLWLVLCRRRPGARQVRSWAWINFATVILAALIHLTSGAVDAPIATSESLALIPVLLFSMADFVHMANGKDLGEWIAKFFRASRTA